MAEPLTPETIAELRRLCDEFIAEKLDFGAQNWTGLVEEDIVLLHKASGLILAARNHLPALLDQIASDRVLIEEAAKGLEPIAKVADGWGILSDKEFLYVSVGKLRAARTLLAKLRGEPC